MTIKVAIAPVHNGVELVEKILGNIFEENNPSQISYMANRIVKPHLEKLKDSCYLVAETPYVDKVYRDSYYHYYSSKQNKNNRNCARISIFDGEVSHEDFQNEDRVKILRTSYRGFIVLRPTAPSVIGRSVISPEALKRNSFLWCATKIHSSVNCIKMDVEGFPHSSQDAETMSCAETTIWAIMEYFGSKYPEYKPTLPSKIIHTLNTVSTQRQIPSKGLNIEQMSFALKEFGFGTRIYSKEGYKNDFEKLLSTYIESGIPLIVGLDNFDTADGGIGHASICIGHESILPEHIDELTANLNLRKDLLDIVKTKNLQIFDWDDIRKKFVFIDDNCPSYQKAYLDNPTIHYPVSWHNCKIKHFIVPFYSKIYLEAYEAKDFVLDFLTNGPVPVADGGQVLIRFYLTSSRSYKDKLALNSSFEKSIKDNILGMHMPKFIWVAELSNKDLMKQKKANGLILLDATEANISFNKPLIIACYEGNTIEIEQSSGKLSRFTLPLPPFTIYENNLKYL